MSVSKNARSSQIMQNIKKGVYVNQGKFANYGSIPEDSIYYHTRLAEKADRERAERIAQSKMRLRQKGLA
tara:strand:- start:992 stop:1201 length:210 start_codon:yes stop_codon:yes gene_type:complete